MTKFCFTYTLPCLWGAIGGTTCPFVCMLLSLVASLRDGPQWFPPPGVHTLVQSPPTLYQDWCMWWIECSKSDSMSPLRLGCKRISLLPWALSLSWITCRGGSQLPCHENTHACVEVHVAKNTNSLTMARDLSNCVNGSVSHGWLQPWPIAWLQPQERLWVRTTQLYCSWILTPQ